MISLTWDQVHAWRLSQHCLSPRLERRDYLQAVERACGMQAQVMSAAELAIGARVDGLTGEDVQSALWRDRTLIKTWAMRGTLHLISAEELPLYAAALSPEIDHRWLKYFLYFDITEAQYEAVMAAIPQILGAEPMTRQELATAVAEHAGEPQLADLLVSSSWGSLWKPSAWRGDLCFGPDLGRNVTFVNPRRWIGEWQTVDPQMAQQKLARRYLTAYGPATPKDFALWWSGGAGLTLAKKLFRSMGAELEEVDVEGWRAIALRATLGPMQEVEPQRVVRLLPLFDAYTVGVGRDLDPLLPREYKLQVYRPQGWISAVVLVDGRMEGVWEQKNGRSQTTLTVRMFAGTASAHVREGVEAEAERLGRFLSSRVVVEIE